MKLNISAPKSLGCEFVLRTCFRGNALQQLTGFLGLAAPGAMALSKTQDEYCYVCDSWWNPQDIQKHPDVMDVAERLGYDPLDFDEQKLRGRYYPF